MSDIVERLQAQFEHGIMGVPDDHVFVGYGEAAAEISRLRAEVERLREALQWYASPEAWVINELEDANGDYGRRARKALEGGE